MAIIAISGLVKSCGATTALDGLDGPWPVARCTVLDPLTGLEARAGIHHLEVADGRVRFAVDGEHLDAAVKHLRGFGLRALTSHPPTLEELMLRHYGTDLAGDAGAA